MDPSDVTMKIDLGKINNDSGYLSMSLNVKGDGDGSMYVYLHEDGKRDGQLMYLSLQDYNDLRKIMKKTDEALRSLSEKGQLKRLG